MGVKVARSVMATEDDCGALTQRPVVFVRDGGAESRRGLPNERRE